MTYTAAQHRTALESTPRPSPSAPHLLSNVYSNTWLADPKSKKKNATMAVEHSYLFTGFHI
jgi:hypothetical protein